MRPIIGLNCDVALYGERLRIELWQGYAQAVERAGGMPILLPPTNDDDLIQAQIGLISGLVLIGGADYDPSLYGAELHPKTALVQATRGAYDFKLANAALQQKLPTLGICGGMQLVNIVRGGILHTHLPDVVGDEVRHAVASVTDAHEVTIETGSRLAAAVGKSRLTVNSSHHQAVARIGRGLHVTARSVLDNVIEAIESTEADEFLLCLQWHPERLIDRPQHLALFEALVQASDKVGETARKLTKKPR